MAAYRLKSINYFFKELNLLNILSQVKTFEVIQKNVLGQTIDPFTVYITGKFEVRSAHVGVRKFIPSLLIVC